MKKIKLSAVAAMLMAGTASAQITETVTIDRNYNSGANIAEYNAADTTDPFNGLANVGGHAFQAGTGVGVASLGGTNTGLRRVAFFFELPTGIFAEQITNASLRFRLNTYVTPTTGLDIYWAPLDTLGTTNQAYAISTFSSTAFTNTGLSLATNAATGTNYTFNVTSLVEQAVAISNATTVVAFRFQMEDDTSLTYGTLNNYNLIGFGGANEANRPALTLSVFTEALWEAGSGDWSSTANWEGGSAAVNGVSVIFNGAGGNSTNDGTMANVKAINFSTNTTGAYNVGGNGLTMTGGITNNSSVAQTVSMDLTLGASQTFNAGAGDLTVDGAINLSTNTLTASGNQTVVANGAMAGSGGLVKQGAGTLILSAGNTYSGGIILGQGTLRLDHVNAAGSGMIAQSTNNSTLQINTTGTVANTMSIYNIQTMQTVTLSGDKTLNNATYTVDADTTTTESGNLTGDGGITKQGTGTLLVTGDNSFIGAVAVNEGVLELASTVGGAAATTTSVSVASGATLLLSQSEQVNDTAGVTLSGGTIQRGGGVSEVFGDLTIAGGSTLDFGTGAIGDLQFQNYTYTGSSLIQLQNFLPGNRLQFLSSSFNSGNLTQLDFNGFGYNTGLDGSYFTITAIPEPSTYLAAVGVLGMFVLSMGRRGSRRWGRPILDFSASSAHPRAP